MATRPIKKSASSTTSKKRRSKTGTKNRPVDWTTLPDEKLLDVRICDLKLEIGGSIIEKCLERLYKELAARHLRLKPKCWLSDDWFSPDGTPGIAVPFYMAHPRLKRLERNQMLEVEGGTQAWCMRILRHEAGHAIDTAFRLNRRKKYRATFGNYSDPYPETYQPKPRSKSYVMHLEHWYSQSHPSEDFAETFAVWLKPRSRWRTEYAGWKALKKVEYIDELMSQIANKSPAVRSRATIDPVHRIRKTLREHYADRLARYSIDCPKLFDRELQFLFPQITKTRRTKLAATFLQKNRADLSQIVAQWTGEYRYNINQVLREMIDRCRELNLLADGDETQLKQNAAVMLTAHTMKNLRGGYHRVAL